MLVHSSDHIIMLVYLQLTVHVLVCDMIWERLYHAVVMVAILITPSFDSICFVFVSTVGMRKPHQSICLFDN